MCPRTEQLQRLVGGQIAPEQRTPLADHAATCPSCHAAVAALMTRSGAAPDRALAAGTVVGGRFRIDQVLGIGGMGIVVAATHLELGNRVAIKFMRDEMLASAGAIERFIREARAVVQLRTDHVCRVLDVARLDTGAPYIVMELLDGVDLARTIATRPLPATIAVEYILQASVALAEAHALGIVHRDLKPANLFVTRRRDSSPLVKVLDFGIAKALSESDARLTQTSVLLGSPGYMSPEQLESPRDVDARTDIWALGVTLYQLLAARLPFWGRNQTEVAVKVALESPPPLPGVDPRLAAVVMRCLEKPPDSRYPHVAALAADLAPFGGPRARSIAAAVAQEPVATTAPVALPVVRHAPTAASEAGELVRPATDATAVRAPARRSQRASWIAAVVVVALGGGAAAFALRGPGSPDVAAPAGGSAPVASPGAATPGSAAAGSATAPAGSASAPAVEDPWAPRPRPAAAPAAKPVQTAKPVAHPKDAPHPSMIAANLIETMKRACTQMSAPAVVDSVSSVQVVSICCMAHDQAHAQLAFARLVDAGMRDKLQRNCTQLGVALH